MAAKLKKRALAEYQSQVETVSRESVDDEGTADARKAKKLKLLLPKSRLAERSLSHQSSVGGESTGTVTGSTSGSASAGIVLASDLLFPIDKTGNPREVTALLVQLAPKIRCTNNF